MLLLLVVQVGLVVRDQVLVVHAAREAVRAASVGAARRRGAPGRACGPARSTPTGCTVTVERDGGSGESVEVRRDATVA